MLGNSTLDDLLVLNADRIPLKHFGSDRSVRMWWNAKTRRPNQGPRKEYKKKSTNENVYDASTESEDEEDNLLDDRDEFTASL